MQAFRYFTEPLRVHASLVVFVEELIGRDDLFVQELFTSAKLFSVKHDFVLLVRHLAFYLAYLALEDLHLISPAEALPGSWYIDARGHNGSLVAKVSLILVVTVRKYRGDAPREDDFLILVIVRIIKHVKACGQVLGQLLSLDALNSRDLLA